MTEDRAEAQADLALALLGGVPDHPHDVSKRLDGVLRSAVWRLDPPDPDVDSFAARPSYVPFASGTPADLHREDVVQALAAAWQAAYAQLIQEQPEAVVRLAVENPDDAARLADTAARAGAYVAVHINRSSARVSWSWPLRIGVTDGHPLLDELRRSLPELTEIVLLDDRRDVEVDLLIAPEPEVADELAACGIRAGVVVVADADELANPHRTSRMFHAFATLFVPDLAQGSWWYDMLVELSHDAPLDVAARRIPGAILLAPAKALWLTSVRTYLTQLLRNGPDVPDVHPPAGLSEVLASVRFNSETEGALAVANLLRSAGTPMRVTVNYPTAGPVDLPAFGLGIDDAVDAEPAMEAPAERAHEEAALEEEYDEDEEAAPEAVPNEPSPDEILGEQPPGQPSNGDQRAGPSQAWPRIDAPDEVAAGSRFTVLIGLRHDADVGIQFVSTGALPTAEDVGVTVVVDGFAVEEGELDFTVNLARRAARELKLQAVDDPTLRAERMIGVRYTVGGALCAYAMRPILVRGATPAPPGTLETPPPGPTTATPIAATDPAAPTLVLTLQQGADLAGLTWQWTATSDKLVLPMTPPDQLRTTLDDTARDFQAKLVREGSVSSGDQLYNRLFATGRRLREKVPDAIISALRAAAAATAPDPPSVLLLSSEARIPWELAVIEPPLTDTASPFLCAQVTMGRWIMGAHGKPPAPPDSSRPVASRAVVVGDYAGLSTWNVLPQAETETATLVGQGAQQLPAEYQSVRDVVHGNPEVDVLHFATHGRFLEGQREEGLVLVDRSGMEPVEVYFTPDDVEAGRLPQGPLVFLNCCQVGAGQTILGDYAGMAAAFTRIGARAVIAPLWEIDDALAAVAAKDFYAAVTASTVGAAVSALRGRFTADTAAQPATARYGSFLAYQYFGHPNLTLTKRAP